MKLVRHGGCAGRRHLTKRLESFNCSQSEQRIRRYRSISALVVVFGLIGAVQITTQHTANAAGCNGGGIAGNVVSAQCATPGAGGSGAYTAVAKGWVTTARYPDRPCHYTAANGAVVQSYFGDGRMNGGALQTGICLINNYGAGTDVVGLAKQAIPAPKPTADYKANFLTGAEVQFSSTDIQNYQVPVPNFPNAHIVITALQIKWDFGDGTSSLDLNPKHTYQDIGPIPTNKGLHVAHVTVTGNWRVTLLDGTLGDTVDLGNYTGTGALDRSIVQVWSKQTEPNS